MGAPKQNLDKEDLVRTTAVLPRFEATYIRLAETRHTYQQVKFSCLCEHDNATLKKVLSVGFSKQMLMKKTGYVLPIRLPRIEATSILLAETLHMHQQMTFVLPL